MTANRKYQLHAFTRTAMLLVGFLCVFAIHRQAYLITIELALLPVLAFNSGWKTLSRYMLIGILPLTLMWIVFFAVTKQLGNAIFMQQICRIVKLLILTTTVQIAIAIPQRYLQDTFRKLGFKGETLLVIVGSYFVWIDIVRRTDRILVARFAQGYIGKRNFINKLRQLPYLLVPLITTVLRTAKIRSDSWASKDVMHRLERMDYEKIAPNNPFNIIVAILISFIFCFLCFQILQK